MFTGFAAYWVMKEAKSTEKGYIYLFGALPKGILYVIIPLQGQFLHIPRHTRLSCEGNLGQPQKENRVSLNDLVERMNPFYEVILS